MAISLSLNINAFFGTVPATQHFFKILNYVTMYENKILSKTGEQNSCNLFMYDIPDNIAEDLFPTIYKYEAFPTKLTVIEMALLVFPMLQNLPSHRNGIFHGCTYIVRVRFYFSGRK